MLETELPTQEGPVLADEATLSDPTVANLLDCTKVRCSSKAAMVGVDGFEPPTSAL